MNVGEFGKMLAEEATKAPSYVRRKALPGYFRVNPGLVASSDSYWRGHWGQAGG